MNFSEALVLLKLGKRVKRPYWEGACVMVDLYRETDGVLTPALLESPIYGQRSYLKEPTLYVGHYADLLADDWELVGEGPPEVRNRLERVSEEDR
jgi:hypothetical protein